MITLRYLSFSPRCASIKPFFLLSEVIMGKADKVKFEIPMLSASSLIIGETEKRINFGACEIDFDQIPDGIVEPTVICHGKAHIATPFLKENGVIFRMPEDNVMYNALKEACEEIASHVSSCEKRINEIEDKINPNPLFNFDT